MVLTIDVGNTHIEIGLFQQDALAGSWRIATGVNRTEDEFMAFITHFLTLRNHSPEMVEGIAISSVVPPVTEILQKMGEKYFHDPPLVVDHRKKLGIRIRYKNPAAVGADRLCAAVAAYHTYRQAVLVVDFGTATTFDIINGKAEYLGGIISPGLETTAWALYRRAAKLPEISLTFPANTIGTTTEESMQAGIMLGTVKMVDGLLEAIVEELGEKPRIIATGGLARLIQPKTKMIETVVDHLVQQGLYQIYRLNSGKNN